MSEYLSFNSLGQWELHKAIGDAGSLMAPPKDEGVPGNKPFKVFRGKALTGELHEDFGQRGALKDFGGGKRPKANKINWKNVGKPHKNVDSVYDERNPGVGLD